MSGNPSPIWNIIGTIMYFMTLDRLGRDGDAPQCPYFSAWSL
jgi:hypothetical protein